MIAEPPTRARRSLRRSVAYAFAPLVVLVVAAATCQFLLARTVHLDVRRLFEELREVELVRAVVDELRGVQQWLEAAPTATVATHALVIHDVRQHHAAAMAAVRRFERANDPSRPAHTRDEDALRRDVAGGIDELAAKLEAGSPLAELAAPLAKALAAATALATNIGEESRRIGDELDRRGDDMTQFLLLLGIASTAIVGALGWLLLRRVLLPVQELQRAAVRLGRGELDVPIPRHRDDELGDLATTLRGMADHLRQSRTELEARVEARSREVVRSARLAQLGTLAAGIAHEINNPLASIVASVEGVLRELRRPGGAPNEGVREYLELVHAEALRVRDITARLLRFARHDAPRRDVVWLAAEAREVAAMFAHQLAGAGVQLDVAPADAGPPIVGDPAEWRQVLFNLVRNALDASPRGGRIQVRVAAAGDDVELSVADEGPGIDLDQQDRIFEPFFTTKAPGQGTGLGLAIVHRIVESHGGRIRVANGRVGACFTITVPAPR